MLLMALPYGLASDTPNKTLFLLLTFLGIKFYIHLQFV